MAQQNVDPPLLLPLRARNEEERRVEAPTAAWRALGANRGAEELGGGGEAERYRGAEEAGGGGEAERAGGGGEAERAGRRGGVTVADEPSLALLL